MLEFAGRYSNPDLLLKKGKYWSVIFRESTTTLGNCIIICNRKYPTLSKLTADEMAEFPKMCSWFENKTKKLYGAVKFNYIAYMMKENFVHFHAIPRYDKTIERYGLIWEDLDWPKGSKCNKIEVSQEVKNAIINDLKS